MECSIPRWVCLCRISRRNHSLKQIFSHAPSVYGFSSARFQMRSLGCGMIRARNNNTTKERVTRMDWFLFRCGSWTEKITALLSFPVLLALYAVVYTLRFAARFLESVEFIISGLYLSIRDEIFSPRTMMDAKKKYMQTYTPWDMPRDSSRA